MDKSMEHALVTPRRRQRQRQQQRQLGACLLVVMTVMPSVVHAIVPQGIYTDPMNWIDPDTPKEAHLKEIPLQPMTFWRGAPTENYTLIFSDEFEDSKRTFEAGFDRRWTALDNLDETNMGQHYFLPQAVQVDKGNVIITTSKPKEKYRNTKYVSGSLQTWNKFCYTGGFVEVRAILPGKWGIPGTWPAIWIMGNLGRATYLGSQDGTWPWSFDTCSPWVENAQKIKQKINACGNLTDKHHAGTYPEDFGLRKNHGRGATEIDVIEAQIRAKDQPAFVSTSLQIRPSLQDDLRPPSETLPGPGQWYQGLKFGDYSRINSDYYGDKGLDAISALTQLDPNVFNSYHLYQLDWSPGPEGYIRWWMDGTFLFEIPGSALNVWSEGVPPRLIPVEPSYLILSTAVSEKFSPPCDGQVCDSLWPSNFTIDYVRVYQGNRNEYTSIGCDPAAFPTSDWIFAHPVEYGLPWYVSLRIDLALLELFTVLNAVASLLIATKGHKVPRFSAAYISTMWFTAGFYAVFSSGVSSIDEVHWIHTAIACLCGVVFGGVSSLIPVCTLGAACGFFLSILALEFVNNWLIHVLCGTLTVAGIVASFLRLNAKHVLIVATALCGGLSFLMSFSFWFAGGYVSSNIWHATGFVLGGAGYKATTVVTHHDMVQWPVLAFVIVFSLALQYYSARGSLSYSKEKLSPKYRFPPVSASSDARTLRQDESSSEKINFFSPSKLPQNMKQYAPIFRIAANVQRSFGFQPDSFRNQTEHIVVLLTNSARKNGNPYRTLHDLVFSNYSKWCHKIKVPSLQWNETRPPQGGMSSVDEISVDLCIFFFVWGEAGNFRHTPEFLCFLFHKLKEEFPAVRHMGREPGFFLDTVITPVYKLISAQMGSSFDHQDRHNYDDFNEFFWTSKCLEFDYRHEEMFDSMSPAPVTRLGRRNLGALNGSKAHVRHRKSIAEAISESSKTFLEKRTWLTPLRAFIRIFEFHVVTFHFLVVLAFARKQELNVTESVKLLSSTLISPFVLSVLRDALDIAAVYHEHVSVAQMGRHVAKIILHLTLTTVTVMMYRYAWSHGDLWWTSYYSTALLLHIPGAATALLQVFPQLNNWLRRTELAPVAYVRDFLNPMNRLYVGDNVLDPASASFGYQLFWVTMLSWKLFFSYKFEISPLVTPTFLLYADHVENRVSIILTGFLVLLNWIPFFFVYCVDITIWNAIWVAFTGTFVGFSSQIGEIRNFTRVRAAFARAADAFNTKLISVNSKTGSQIAESRSSSTSYGSVFGNEVLDRVTDNHDIIRNGKSASAETPLLSFSRRKQTAVELKDQRRRKWFSFSVAWDAIVDTMRADDLISTNEKYLLHFQRIDGYQREIFLPMFQLAGCFEAFTSSISDLYSQENVVSERELQDALLDTMGGNPMIEEAIEEVWELTTWILINVLGPCHTNDVRYICSTLNSWAARGVFRTLDLHKVGTCARALADVLSLMKSNLSSWKSNAKFVPVRKSPADYSSYQFSQATTSLRPISGGMTKSASTTGLSSLGGNVPRRSRGSGITRIAALGHTPKPKEKGKVTHSIPSAHVSQLRDRLRTFLNLAKGMLNRLEERDPLYAESRGVSDRLTWILTQERGFLWDDDYAGDQITLTAFERNSETVVRHLHGLLTLQKIEAEPTSFDAKRRLLFFVNSLFMDMPVAPLLEEMKSWSVMTPFYGEDVLYSKSDLESKRDGLDVHTLLFLQTLYKLDWENFLERVKPKKNLWKDPDTALELRMWASLRGQTLARTVQGMMYYEAAIRLLAEIEQMPSERVEELIKTKFTYVVACQIYGRQKRNNDSKARDIEFLLHRFPNLRVAYIDEIRVNYQKEQSYFSVLIKGGEEVGDVEEVYRVRLPGNPILGEGKPENQNSAIIFTRGESLQTIDMNQDGYIEEALKMRNMLEEFDSGLPDRPYTIVGLPEHIFTGSVSSLANYMALQETSFVTLSQRTLARPLRVRLHYGHPDVFNKLFFITRGGISKASKGINLSEDIFAGYNNCLRGGSVTFPEYIKVGKGRDVGMQQIYKFEAKLAQGAAEQSLSRDVYRLCQRLDVFKLLSFYYNHVGFYLSTSLIIWTVYILLYFNIFRALLSLEGVGGRQPVLLSRLQMMLGSVAFLTTAPLLATISVERGFKAAFREVFMIIVTGGPLYFLFHIGTKWFYFGQTIFAGGAKYRATGRGFVTKHSRFDELFRFYASSHLCAGIEIAAGLLVYYVYTVGLQYFAMTWSLWLVVVSWSLSPFWFNPLAFEWSDVSEDGSMWLRWMRGDGGNPDQSWEAWFKEENGYFVTLKPWAKACVMLKGLLYAAVALGVAATGNPYHSLFKEKTLLPWSICLSTVLVYAMVSLVFFPAGRGESGLVRFMKVIVVIVTTGVVGSSLILVKGMLECLLSMCYLSAAVGCWGLLVAGTNSRLVRMIYFMHDTALGGAYMFIILLLSALYVPGKIQTWLLYNNALSRGVVIEDILRANSRNDERDDDVSLQQLRSIIIEQQRVISALTVSGSDSDGMSSGAKRKDEIVHTLSDNTLNALRNVSESELAALHDASLKLQFIVQQGQNGDSPPQLPFVDSGVSRTRRSYSSTDFADAGRPPFANGSNGTSEGQKKSN